MHELIRDFRLAVRGLLRTPGFTLVAVATLALGIGANTAIFTVVDHVLLRPLEYERSERLVALFEHDVRSGDGRNPTSPANFFDWRDGGATLRDLTAAHPISPVLRGDGRPEQLSGLKATPSLFRLLGVAPLLGRTFDPEGDDDRVVAVGAGTLRAVVGTGPPDLPRLAEVGLDARVFLFTLAVAVLTGLLFGLAPMASALRLDLVATLKPGVRGATSAGRRLRHALVVTEIALALVLLVGAGLLSRSLARLWRLDPGFETARLLTLDVSVAGTEHAAPEAQNPFFDELVAIAAATPGVESLLFGVGVFDPATFAAVALFLLATTLAAAWIPARRATKIEPAVCLREE